jgi:H+/gluconate symporter-like permease
MITAVGMLSAFQDPAVTGFHPVYMAVVVGCGSKLFAWMNDSGFWIICKMSGFTETETIRNSSVMMAIYGCYGSGGDDVDGVVVSFGLKNDYERTFIHKKTGQFN